MLLINLTICLSATSQVVWNPWKAKAKGMADFDDSEFKECVCIEPAVAGSGPVELAPGASWSASQRLSCSAL